MDIQSLIRELRAISPLTMDMSRTLLDGSFTALQEADRAQGFASNTGEYAQRHEIASHLQWHSDRVSSGTDVYPAYEDLRDWSVRAFIAYNAAAESDAVLSRAKSQFYQDVANGFRKTAEFAGNVIGTAASSALSGIGSFFSSLGPLPALLLLGSGVYLLARKS